MSPDFHTVVPAAQGLIGGDASLYEHPVMVALPVELGFVRPADNILGARNRALPSLAR